MKVRVNGETYSYIETETFIRDLTEFLEAHQGDPEFQVSLHILVRRTSNQAKWRRD